MWLYVPPNPCTSSASAPAAEASISASSWQFQALAQSAWWRGKPSASPRWWKRWRRVSWLQRLCGRMLEPSEADLGAAWWMASLAASRASPTAWPESAWRTSTSATCGARPAGSSSRPGPGSCSSRTSPECSRRAAPSAYGETFDAWVSRLREDCSQRRKSARRTSASACSFSHWPTPTALEAGPDFAKLDRSTTGMSLPAKARIWPTPNATDGEKAPAHFSRGPDNPSLPSRAKTWATPKVARGAYTRDNGLAGAERPTLEGQATLWHPCSPQAPTTSPDGPATSSNGLALNQRFVEALMGWPSGWTAFVCSATALSLWKRRMRCALSQFELQPGPPPQLSLFG